LSFIELINVSKVYVQGEVKTVALDSVNLKVEEGEFVAIMGPSGSGKSTLMSILGCLDTPTSGTYLLDRMDVNKLRDDEISEVRSKYIGFVFQSFYLVPYLSVLDNVLLPVEYMSRERKKVVFGKKTPKERAMELLERLGISDKADFKPSQLSGGQKQRTAIARALITSPKVILADEPTGQLDSASGKAVMEIFKELNKEGKTIIVVTHDEKVASYAHRIVKISDGRIVEEVENVSR